MSAQPVPSARNKTKSQSLIQPETETIWSSSPARLSYIKKAIVKRTTARKISLRPRNKNKRSSCNCRTEMKKSKPTAVNQRRAKKNKRNPKRRTRKKKLRARAARRWISSNSSNKTARRNRMKTSEVSITETAHPKPTTKQSTLTKTRRSKPTNTKIPPRKKKSDPPISLRVAQSTKENGLVISNSPPTPYRYRSS